MHILFKMRVPNFTLSVFIFFLFLNTYYLLISLIRSNLVWSFKIIQTIYMILFSSHTPQPSSSLSLSHFASFSTKPWLKAPSHSGRNLSFLSPKIVTLWSMWSSRFPLVPTWLKRSSTVDLYIYYFMGPIWPNKNRYLNHF